MNTKTDADALVSRIALAAGYTPAEVRAGLEFAAREARRTDPPGVFDRGGRFTAEERTAVVAACRPPSRAWPYPEMLTARTAAHCAEVFGAEELVAVKRVARARDRLDDQDALTAHQLLEIIGGTLKPFRRKATAAAA